MTSSLRVYENKSVFKLVNSIEVEGVVAWNKPVSE